MSGNETKLVKAVIQYLQLRGHMAWRNNTGASRFQNAPGSPVRYVRFGKRGASDVLGVERVTGRIIAVECKDKGEKPTPEQEQFLAGVRKRNGIGILAYSLDDVEDGLNGANSNV